MSSSESNESDTEQILKALTKSQIAQSPALGKLENELIHFENETNQIDSLDLVEMKVRNIASIFGQTLLTTKFLEKTKEIKIFKNPSKLPSIQDHFNQMELEIQNIRIQSYIPHNFKVNLDHSISHRLQSMRQAQSSDLVSNYLENEFSRFNRAIEKIIEFNEDDDFNFNDINNKIEALQSENEKLKVKATYLQIRLNEKLDKQSRNGNEIDKSNLIQQIIQLYKETNEEKEKHSELLNSFAQKVVHFPESRNRLLSTYGVASQQLRRLERGKIKMVEENAKTIVIKEKEYSKKMIDDEIMILIDKKNNILNSLAKIEQQEKRFISALKDLNQ